MEQKKLKEILNEDSNLISEFLEERIYIKAKKQIKEIKGFYTHLIINVVSIPVIIYVNLKFVPGFHFFWFAVGGVLIATFLHWFGVFGLEKIGLGKKWEKRIMNEFMNQKN